MIIGGKAYTPEEMKLLHQKFVGTFSGDGEEVLEHIKDFCMYDEPFGSGLSSSEMARRGAFKDVYQFIEAMSSAD